MINLLSKERWDQIGLGHFVKMVQRISDCDVNLKSSLLVMNNVCPDWKILKMCWDINEYDQCKYIISFNTEDCWHGTWIDKDENIINYEVPARKRAFFCKVFLPNPDAFFVPKEVFPQVCNKKSIEGIMERILEDEIEIVSFPFLLRTFDERRSKKKLKLSKVLKNKLKKFGVVDNEDIEKIQDWKEDRRQRLEYDKIIRKKYDEFFKEFMVNRHDLKLKIFSG